jgi:sodium/potassium-transporting ATPase subunit alpha
MKATKYFFGGFGSVLFVASILIFIAWKPLGQPLAVAKPALAIVLLVVLIHQEASRSIMVSNISNTL